MLAVLAGSLIACTMNSLNSGPKAEYGTTPAEQQKQQDRVLVKKVESTRADVEQIPGPKQYRSYALALCNAYGAGVFERKSGIEPRLAEATALADQIATKAPYEAHNVKAFKGLLLICSGNIPGGEETLFESLDIKPGRDAGEMLAVLYGSSGEFKRVGDVCARVVPQLKEQERFMMISTCKEQLHSTSDDGTFFWARPEDIAFWNSQQERLEEEKTLRASEEAKQLAAILEKQRTKWSQHREQQRLAEERVARRKESRDACFATCKEGSDTCNQGCATPDCAPACDKTYEACKAECNARYE